MATATHDDAELDASVLTVLDAMEAAEPGSRAEYLDGSYTLNRPAGLHSNTAAELLTALRAVVPSGYRVVHEVRVRFGRSWLVPDLVVVNEKPLLADAKIFEPADLLLMVEIISPATEHKDRTAKRSFCQSYEIDYWIVSPGDPWGTVERMDYGGGVIPFPG